jgi:serine/threonine-protein kinase
MAADHDLLFGLLALQNGLINQGQLVAAFQAWTLDKARALADHLVGRGDLDVDDRSAVEALVARHLKKHGGDVERSLAAITAGPSTHESLAAIGDADIEHTLARIASGSDGDHDRTMTYAVGTATSDGQRFRVLRPHARGGLGAVFVALDEELHREVALKEMLDRYADDAVSRQRFLLEAEITGGLEHPGIVPVYGLGTYAGGRPFYAMRFIKGDSLKEAVEHFHADEALKADPGRRSLELRKLLLRFLDVCNAIEYAHSRGVLHRDLKPGNVIVGKHGETLVVDWGLAKPLGRAEPGAASGERPLTPSSASGTAETLPGSALGTPAYMSPEQAAGDLEHLGPQSDVYSLGATLYCLLTGKPPFEGEVGDVLRAVQRGAFAPPRKLDPTVDAALESVCRKAMALKPEERYPSPKALADDVERWMADEPVSAYPEPFTKRAGRWARRHRPLVAGAAALLVTAVVALSIGTVLINHERARAEQSFRQARQAVDDYFTAVSESKLLNVPNLQPLRKELLDRALKYYQGFIRERGGDRSVRAELAATYYRVAWITGYVGTADNALSAYRQALALYEGLVRDHPGELRYQVDLAIVCNDLGNLLRGMGQRDEALRIHRKALAVREATARAHPDGVRFQNELAKSYGNIASVLGDSGQQAEALRGFQRAAAINESLVRARPTVVAFPSDLGVHHNSVEAIEEDLAKDHNRIGNLLGQMNRPEESVRSFEKAAAILETLIAREPEVEGRQATLADVENRIGFRLKQEQKYDEAMRHHQKARALLEGLIARNPSVPGYRGGLASCELYLVGLLTDSGRPAEALPLLRQAQAILEKLAAEQPTVPWYRKSLALQSLYFGRLPATVLPPSEALEALKKGETLFAAAPDLIPVDHYNLACIRARIVPLLGQRSAERRSAEASAIETLRRAIDLGYKDFANMKQDSDLDALRMLPEFQALLNPKDVGVDSRTVTKP